MRKIVVGAFVSLDGVMQAPGGPEEDPTGGFQHGGWTVPYWDDVTGAAMGETFSAPFDLLLGRKTYDIFAAHWPYVQMDPKASDFDALSVEIATRFNAITKYVATHRPESLTWQNSRGLGTDVVGALRELKRQGGSTLLTQGSSGLVHLLLTHDLVDELRLLTYPLVLGRGKRLFGTDAAPAAATALTEPGHEGKTYTTTGPSAVTHGEMSSAISAAVGRQIAFIDVPPEAFAGASRAAGVPPWQVDGLIEDYAHYARGEAAAVSPHVHDVGGVEPRDVGTFARDYAHAFGG